MCFFFPWKLIKTVYKTVYNLLTKKVCCVVLHERRQKASTYEKAKVNRVQNIWRSILRHYGSKSGKRFEFQEFRHFRHFFGMPSNLIKFSIECTENRNFQVMQKGSNPFFKWNLNDFVRAYDTHEFFCSSYFLIQLWVLGHQSPEIMPATIRQRIHAACRAHYVYT